ncbi:MAG: hypothetical protein K9W44_01985 [Candidatus Lokiarchaeota archaeon]|nr:hypothetical protein [Candidatus Harpocratesius repetitus]
MKKHKISAWDRATKGQIWIEAPKLKLFNPKKNNPHMQCIYSNRRLCFRPSHYCANIHPPFDELDRQTASYLQELRVIWEDETNAFDCKDLPFITVSATFLTDYDKFNPTNRKVEYIHSIYLIGLHKEPSDELNEMLEQLPDFLPNLKYIYFEDQFIKEMPSWLNRLSKLTASTLILYRLQNFPQQFFKDHHYLKGLYLLTPKITQLPNLFNLMPEFSELTLYNSKNIHSLPSSLINAPHLEKLKIYSPSAIELTASQYNILKSKKIWLYYNEKAIIFDLNYPNLPFPEYSPRSIRIPIGKIFDDYFDHFSRTYYELAFEYLLDPFKKVPEENMLRMMAEKIDLSK